MTLSLGRMLIEEGYMVSQGTLRPSRDTNSFSDVLNTLTILYFSRKVVEDVLHVVYSFDGGESR